MSDIRYQETRAGLDSLVPRGTRWLGGGLVALAVVLLTAGCRPAEQVDAADPAGTTMVGALDDRVSTEPWTSATRSS